MIRSLGLAALFAAAALFGTASGVFFAFMGDLPQISALDDQQQPTITRVLGKDNAVVAEFANERRVLVTYDQIPVVLRNAIISAEDKDFFSHGGLNLKAIAVTAVRRALFLRRNGGASTITQQVARGVIPNIGFEKSGLAGMERKVKEALFALQIEKRYTKSEILTMYCNHNYWGNGAYGVEAASQLYFSKHVGELTLDEAAMIAGIIQYPNGENPYVSIKNATARRNYTLAQMAANGYITEAEATAAKKRPIVVRGNPNATRSIAPYFAEDVRLQLEQRYGAKAVYEGGMTVKTALDPMLQQAANRALDQTLRNLDQQRGVYRRPAHNLLAEGKSIETYHTPRWSRDPVEGDIMPAIVTGVTAGTIGLTAGKWTGSIAPADYQWARRKADALVRRGDLIDVRVKSVAPKNNTFTAHLDQTPELEGAVVALDNHTGDVLAMIGGKDFQRSQFNRATQAMRQVGSLFKAFVYTTAIDRGFTASTILSDVPSTFVAGPNQPLYQPKNFDNKFMGDVTLRWALEDSRNVPTIRLMDVLGPPAVIETARKFGLTAPLPPLLPIAIGAGDETLWEMTSAYSTFPNQGVRMTPLTILQVTDHEGNVLEDHRPEAHEVIKADTAFIMTSLFQGVTQRGTGQAAASLNWTIGGKTGTTDEATDAWFIGFDPDITVGVWVGYDQKKSMGDTIQGATLALPIWMKIMEPWIAKRRAELGDPPDFERPGNIVYQADEKGFMEVYIAGTEPGGKIQIPASMIGNR